MQKLLVELKNAPTDTPQVCSSASPVLNSSCEVMDSVQNIQLANNNSDVGRSQRRGSSDLRVQNIVYVLNMRGISLMPTTQQKANKLLKQGKAKIIRCDPFTIQLKYATGENRQPVTLGIDPGYDKIGFSAITDKKELISGEVKLRSGISQKLAERRMYRRNRRNKLWYRKPRFLNRISKKENWLAPSIKHKLDSHISLINKIKEILPISDIIIETSSFDTQKMVNPEISGIEYQQGELQGYEIREYLLEKWGRKCAYCGKKNIPLEVEHIIPKSKGGTNRIFNLTLSCQKCNLKKGNKTAEEFGHPEIQKQGKESLKATAFMNNIKRRLVNLLNCKWTYGYISKHNRIKLGLKKSHSNDAFIIAGGNRQLRLVQYIANQIRRNNRCLQINRKGFKPSIRRRRYNLQPYSLVKWNNQLLRIKGISCRGKEVVLENKKSVKIDSVELYKYMRGWQFLPVINDGVSLPQN